MSEFEGDLGNPEGFVPHPDRLRVSASEINHETLEMSPYTAEGLVRLDDFSRILAGRHNLEDRTTLLTLRDGEIFFTGVNFFRQTRKFRRTQVGLVSFQDLVQIALSSGTSVSGLIHAYKERHVQPDDFDGVILDDIADRDMKPTDFQRIPAIIAEDYRKMYYGVLN